MAVAPTARRRRAAIRLLFTVVAPTTAAAVAWLGTRRGARATIHSPRLPACALSRRCRSCSRARWSRVCTVDGLVAVCAEISRTDIPSKKRSTITVRRRTSAKLRATRPSQPRRLSRCAGGRSSARSIVSCTTSSAADASPTRLRASRRRNSACSRSVCALGVGAESWEAIAACSIPRPLHFAQKFGFGGDVRHMAPVPS